MKRTSHDTSRFTLILYKSLVGYNTLALQQGSTVLSGVFLGIGAGETLNIQELKLVGESVTPGADNIQLLNAGSVSCAMYNWVDENITPKWVEIPEGSDNWVGIPGWVTEDQSDLLDWDMPAAQGFVLYVENEGVSITHAGEVKNSNKELVTEGGSVVLGNFNPTPLNIQQVVLSGDNVTPGADNIQLLNAGSVSCAMYNWVDENITPKWVEIPEGSDNWVGIPGWVTEDQSDLLDWDMPAGQGFVLYTENAGVTVTIPSYNNVEAE